jgi:hypothetical protein
MRLRHLESSALDFASGVSPVVTATVKKTTFLVQVREIKVEPNVDKRDLRHGNKPVSGDSDVIIISSDSESESKPRVKEEDIRVQLKEPTATKAKGKAHNQAILDPVPKANMSSAAFDHGSFIEESEIAWTDSDITSFVIEGNLQVTAELWVKRVEYLSEILLRTVKNGQYFSFLFSFPLDHGPFSRLAHCHTQLSSALLPFHLP